MVDSLCNSLRAPWLLFPPRHQHPHLASFLKDSIPISQSQSSPTPTPAPPGSRISPAVLFIIVILAVVFFISGLLHLLVRFLIKKHPFSTSPDPARRRSDEFQGPDAIQRQLQQLFHLHDSGLDQVLIDALPVFLYKEIVGSKEPFDCAVCLCEFAQEDKLRLLPTCGHAFHINCIDTWLLSNSTCPLCRGALFVPSFSTEYPLLDFEDIREEGGFSRDLGVEGQDTALEKRVFSVRLGKFKNLCTNANGAARDGDSGSPSGSVRMEEGETSSNNLDARRCFSMGYYQYVVADSDLQVTLDSTRIKNGDLNGELRVARGRGANEQHSTSTDAMEGKRLGIRSKGESFSVSKIWQWSKKNGKFPASSGNTSPIGDLPWISRNAAEEK